MSSDASVRRRFVPTATLGSIDLDSSAMTSPTAVTQTRPEDLEQYRRELTGYCYRMLGSAFEAEDAVQETMVRAWQGHRHASRAARPCARGSTASPPTSASTCCAAGSGGPGRWTWARPSTAEAVPRRDAPRERVGAADPRRSGRCPSDGDPAEVAAARETIRLAFVTALQHLPARQRAVLILREVLRWQATEVAELLDTTRGVGQQRAPAGPGHARPTAISSAVDRPPIDAEQQALLARYVDAFERYDIAALVALLHDDAVMSMPPYDFWLQAPDEMGKWLLGPGSGCEGSRLVPTSANGCPAFGAVPRRPRGRPHAPGRHPGPRDLRRPDRRAPQLPRHRAVRGLRPAHPSALARPR